MAVNTQRVHTSKLCMRGFQLVCGIIAMCTGAYVLSQFNALDSDISDGLAQSQSSVQAALDAGLTPLAFNGTESEAYNIAVQAAMAAAMAATNGTTTTGGRKLLVSLGYSGSVFADVKNKLGYVIFAAILLMLHGAHYLGAGISKSKRCSCNLPVVPATMVELVLTFLIFIFVMASGSLMASWGVCDASGIGPVCGSYNSTLAFTWIGWLLLLGSIILSIIELVIAVRGRGSNAQDNGKIMEVGAYSSSVPPQVVVTH